MRYPSDDLTDAERARLAPHFTDLDGPVFALTNLPETVKGALFARYSRYPGTLRRLFLDEFADSLPEPTHGYDGEEGKRAAELYERIFVGYGDDPSPSSAARTSPASGRATSSPRSSSAPAWAPTSSSPRATSPTTRRCPARLPLLPRPRARPAVRDRDGLALRRLRGGAADRARVGRRDLPARRRRVGRRAPPRRQRQGLRPAARPAARRLALAHGHLRDRPGLRAADPAPARPPAAGGALLRRRDPRRDQGRDAELRLARRAARARRRVGALPRAAPRRRRALGRAARARPRRGRRGPPVGAPAARRRRRGRAARGAAVRGRRDERGAHARGGGAPRARRARASCSPT